MTMPPDGSCLVSVIIPVFNAEGSIQQAIQSVLEQKVAGVELLVVNDGSTDGSAAKIEAFKDRPEVKVLSHPEGKNQGVCASRRLALTQARGEFVAFLDSDDEYLPGKLSRHIEILQKNPSVALVHGRVVRRTDDPVAAGWTFDLGEEAEIYDLTKKSYFLRRNYICNSTVVCRRSAVLPEADAPPVMIYQSEDWVLWNCVAFRGLLYYDPVPLTMYAYHAGSFTHSLQRRAGAVELTAIEFYLCMLPRLPKLSSQLRALFALLYNLSALAELRRGPAIKPGLIARSLARLFELVKK